MQAFKQRWGGSPTCWTDLPTTRCRMHFGSSLRTWRTAVSSGACRNLIGVEDVRFTRKEVSKILTITDFYTKGALIVIVFLIIVSVTSYQHYPADRDGPAAQIMIMKYVNLTNWFIRGPLLAEGMMIGCISAFIALGLTWLIYAHRQSVCQALLLFSVRLSKWGS